VILRCAVDQPNRWAFRCRANVNGERVAVRRAAGKLFQMTIPATAKLLIPSVVLVLRTNSNPFPADVITQLIITCIIIIRPQRMHSASLQTESMVMVYPSVGHVRKPCKNGLTDRDAVLVGDYCGPKEPCIR